MAGRKPKPTYLKILEGNPGKQKLPKGEPMPEPELPSPPVHLDEYALEEWDRVAGGLYALKVLTSLDKQVLAAYCNTYSLWRTACEELKGLTDFSERDKQKKFILKVQSEMKLLAVEFGLTPSARARLAIDPGRKTKSKFDGLIKTRAT